MSELALLGGSKIRTALFTNRPHVDKTERQYLDDCLDNKFFSRFIGSPVGDFRKFLAMTSAEAVELADFWSVLGGPYVRRFEGAFAKKHGAAFAVSSNSATSSITSAVLACGIKPGDQVITSPMSFTATATAIKIAGADVVFADIDPQTFCISAETIRKRITPKTKAVVVVHLFGNAGDILAIQKLCVDQGLILIEDTAQALHTKKNGRYLGTFGAAGTFSFQETKNIMTGEGGMAITNDPRIAYKLRLIRNHGEAMVYDGVDDQELIDAAIGYNFRLPEPLAAIGFAQTAKIEFLNAIRSENFATLKHGLERFPFLKMTNFTNDQEHFAPHVAPMTFRHEKVHRNTFAEALRAEGIPVSTGYPRLLNENPLTREDLSHTPNARIINDERYIGFGAIAYPNAAEDMRDIIAAVEKVERNLGQLEKVNLNYIKKREYNSGRL